VIGLAGAEIEDGSILLINLSFSFSRLIFSLLPSSSLSILSIKKKTSLSLCFF